MHRIEPIIKKPNDRIPIRLPATATSKCLRCIQATAPINAKTEKIIKINEQPFVS